MTDATVHELEPWLDKPALAKHLAVSTRWIERRLHDGLPSTWIAERRKFKVSEVEAWLEQHGHMRRAG